MLKRCVRARSTAAAFCARCYQPADLPGPSQEPEILEGDNDDDDDDDGDVQFWSNAYQHLLPPTKKKSNVYKLCRCALQRRCRGRACAARRWSCLRSLTRGVHRAAREVNPRAVTAAGKPYGRGYVFCQVCWDTNKLRSPLIRCTSGTTNVITHMKTKHKAQWKEVNTPAEPTAPRVAQSGRVESGRAQLASGSSNPGAKTARSSGGDQRQPTLGAGAFGMTRMQRLVPYTHDVLARQWSCALVCGNRPAALGEETEMRRFLRMLGDFTPPVARTITSHEESFYDQAVKCVRDELVHEGIINADGSKLDIPLLSISYDTTPLGLRGLNCVTLNGHYLTRDFVPMKVAFRTGVFSVPEAEEREHVTRGTSGNLSEWSVRTLKDFTVVPQVWPDNKMTDWLFGATTDNASAETKAAVDVMSIFGHRCGNHTFDLPLKRLLKVKKEKRAEVMGEDVEEDVEEPEDDQEEAEVRISSVENLRIANLIDVGAIAASKMKKGHAAARFLRIQALAGVDEPKVLVSRAETRYAMSARIADRLLLLREFVNEALDLVKLPNFAEEDWKTLLQCGAFLRAAEDLTVALQSREYLIGDHIGQLYNFLQLLRHPETMRVHPANFKPSVAQLNIASRRGAAGPEEHAEAFNMWDKKHRTQYLSPGVITDDSDIFVKRFKEEMEWRMGATKHQFSSMPALLATALHPLYKNFVLDPAQHGLFQPQSKAHAVSTLGRLLRKVKVNGAAGAEAGGEEPAAKKHKPSIIAINLPGYNVPPSVVASLNDELEAWKKVELCESTQADFWKAQLNSTCPRFKALPRVARAVLGLPNTSAECERDFSAVKRLLSDQRKGMDTATVERKLFLMLNKRMWEANPGVHLPC